MEMTDEYFLSTLAMVLMRIGGYMLFLTCTATLNVEFSMLFHFKIGESYLDSTLICIMCIKSKIMQFMHPFYIILNDIQCRYFRYYTHYSSVTKPIELLYCIYYLH